MISLTENYSYLKHGLIFTGGIVSPLVIISLILLLVGSFDQFVYFVFEFPRMYISTVSNKVAKQMLETFTPLILEGYEIFWGMAGLGLGPQRDDPW